MSKLDVGAGVSTSVSARITDGVGRLRGIWVTYLPGDRVGLDGPSCLRVPVRASFPPDATSFRGPKRQSALWAAPRGRR